MHRGARREPIFRRDDHCLLFLGSLEEAVGHHGLEVHAYSLMPNHYHLLVRSPLGNLSRCMRHLNGTYTQRLNLRYGWDGPVFRGRFRSQPVEKEEYLDHLFAYVHLNPLAAGLAKRLDEPCWTSLRAYLGKGRAPAWLRTEFFITRLGGRSAVEKFVRARRKRPDEWPDELDRETGWIQELTPRRDECVVGEDAITSRASVDEVLRQVAREAACTVAALKKPEMGRGANSARRLAVWALSRAQRFSHREIAAALGMSEGQVAKVLWRFRRAPPGQPLLAWMEVLAAGSRPRCGT
jgi:putative transposase